MDSQKFQDSCYYVLYMFQIFIRVIYISITIGLIAGNVIVAAFATVVFGCFLMWVVQRYMYKLKRSLLMAKDVRVTMLKSVIENIRFIKTKGLENFFAAKVYEKRAVEIKYLYYMAWVLFVVCTLNWFIPSSCYVGCILWVLFFASKMSIGILGSLLKNLQNFESAIRAIPSIISFFVD